MEISKLLADTEKNILADSIGYISIIDVIIRYPHNRNSAIYITTDDLNTIDVKKMEELAIKYSSELIGVIFLIPIAKHSSGKAVEENRDLVCIFITERKY